MLEYLVVNIIFSVLLGCLLVAIRRAPARLKFGVTLIAIGAWLVPWQWVDLPTVKPIAEPVYRVKLESLSSLEQLLAKDRDNATDMAHSVAQIPDLSVPTAEVSVAQNGLTRADIQWVLFVSLLIGLLLGAIKFGLSVRAYIHSERQWYRRSRPADELFHYLRDLPAHRYIHIRVLDGTVPGMTSGFRKPVIWLGDAVKKPEDIRSVLLHEYVHITQHDLYWSWGLHFVQNLFWWNPIVGMFCEKASAYMESSCDELCVKLIGEDAYACSIIELTLNSYASPIDQLALGLRKSHSEVVNRMRSLQQTGPFKFIHGVVASGVLLVSILAALLVTYDKSFFTVQLNDVGDSASRSDQALYQVSATVQPFFEVTQLLARGEVTEAAARLSELKQAQGIPGLSDKEFQILLFNVSAMVYGDMNQYDKILSEYKSVFDKSVIFMDNHGPRNVAIAHIKLGQYEEALAVLERVHSEGNKSGPTDILIAQACFLAGQYHRAIDYAREGLKHLPSRPFNQFAEPLFYQVIAKSALALNDKNLLVDSLAVLNINDVSELDDITFTNQRPPYLYFQYAFIDGRDVDRIDQIKFPLPDKLLASANPRVQVVMNEAAMLYEKAKPDQAIRVLQQGYQRLAAGVSHAEQSKILEFLFVLQLQNGSSPHLFQTAESLAALPGVRKSLLLRALHVLSTDKHKNFAAHIEYFERYIALLNEPSLASDHEILNRYFGAEDDQKVLPALQRISAFYESNNYVPDVRTINHLISLYDKFGDREKSEHYKSMLHEHYPRAYNFILG